jgi:hypothetical protein
MFDGYDSYINGKCTIIYKEFNIPHNAYKEVDNIIFIAILLINIVLAILDVTLLA